MAVMDTFPDPDSAWRDGRAFGAAAARRTASEMTSTRMSDDELKRVGMQGISEVVARADSLVAGGLERDIVIAWMEGASHAFNLELNRAASLLSAADPSANEN